MLWGLEAAVGTAMFAGLRSYGGTLDVIIWFHSYMPIWEWILIGNAELDCSVLTKTNDLSHTEPEVPCPISRLETSCSVMMTPTDELYQTRYVHPSVLTFGLRETGWPIPGEAVWCYLRGRSVLWGGGSLCNAPQAWVGDPVSGVSASATGQ